MEKESNPINTPEVKEVKEKGVPVAIFDSMEEFKKITNSSIDNPELLQMMKDKGIEFDSGVIAVEIGGKQELMSTSREDFGTLLSLEKIEKILNNLRMVGEEKPLGYLPISTLREICGMEPQKMREELEAKGLAVIELTEEESRIGSGALYAYDREALGRILESGRSILEKNQWPTEPDEFVRHLKVFAENPDLYNLVAHTFADPHLRKE